MLLPVQIGTISVRALRGGSVWVVALIGEHDHSTHKLRAEQTRRVWQPDARIVIDLSGATFIDSSVITWLLRTRRALAATGHPAVRVVAGPPDRLTARVLDQLSPNLRHRLGCCRTLAEALAEQPPSAPPVAHHTPMTVESPSVAPADEELAKAFDRVGTRAWRLAAWIVDDPDIADEIVVETFTQFAGVGALTDDAKLLHDVRCRSVGDPDPCGDDADSSATPSRSHLTA